MTIFNYLIFISLGFNILISLIILFNNTKAQVNRLYFAFITSLNLWIIANYLENEPGLIGTNIRLFLRLDFAAALMIFYYWYRFCSVFTKIIPFKKYEKIIRPTIFITILLLAILSIFSELIIKLAWFKDGVIHFEVGFLWTMYFLLVLVLSAGGIVILLIGKKNAKQNRDRLLVKQINFILWGFIISIGNAVFINLFLQTLDLVNINISRLGLYGMSVLILFTAYSIFKLRLFNYRLMAQNGLIYFFLLFLIIITYLLAVLSTELLTGGLQPKYFFYISLITILIGVYTLPRVEKAFRRYTDKIFFKDKYDYKEASLMLTKLVGKNYELKKLLIEAAGAIKNIFKVESVYFLLIPENRLIGVGDHKKEIDRTEKIKFDDNKKLANWREELIIDKTKINEIQTELTKIIRADYNLGVAEALISDNNLIGVAILGKKYNEELFTDEDLKLLSIFTLQITLAIVKAKLYETIKDYSENLEKMVDERTKQINKLQEDQNRAFLDITHEMQTPLTIMRGELGMLRNELNNNPKIDKFEKSIDRISHFISNMLRLSKLDFADNLKKGKINLSLVMKNLSEEFEIISSANNIDFRTKIQPDVMIIGDEYKIIELITNLVSNAIKYTDNERQVDMNLIQTDKIAKIEIKDSGIGIDEKDLPNIFIRFYHAKNQQKNNSTGLGLAICKKIVEIHNGNIKIESQKKMGTTVTVILPCL